MTETQMLIAKLTKLVNEHPNTSIVVDIGQSMCSGWDTVVNCSFLEEQDVIELTTSISQS